MERSAWAPPIVAVWANFAGEASAGLLLKSNEDSACRALKGMGWSRPALAIAETRVSRPESCAFRRLMSLSNDCNNFGSTSRRVVLKGAALLTVFLVVSHLFEKQPGAATAEPLPFGREEFSSSFNVSKGALGIGLQELRVPQDAVQLSNEFIIISSVDRTGQGVKQDKRLRPGLVIKAVQGQPLTGMKAEEAIELLQLTFQAASSGQSPIIAITFSTECMSSPAEPDFCYNSVQPEDSIIGILGDTSMGASATTDLPQTNDDIFRPPRGLELSPKYGRNEF